MAKIADDFDARSIEPIGIMCAPCLAMQFEWSVHHVPGYVARPAITFGNIGGAVCEAHLRAIVQHVGWGGAEFVKLPELVDPHGDPSTT